jgi:2-polyprenyl-3-methyl-5-hydroxy-6-metoxy-1,4-benzoquinol methylase
MASHEQNRDKAGVEHWDNTERNTGVPLAAFAPGPGLRGFGRRMWHEVLGQALSPVRRPGATLLELGCGGSAYLPYFARTLGFTVSGIDYSTGGIDQARLLCAAHGVTPTLHCVDFFNAPAELAGQFDAVVSFGVVEHFTDTRATVAAFSRFLRPGGRLVTVVPNMGGLCGLGQRVIAPGVFAVHEVIDPLRLRRAHEDCDLNVIRCDYFMFSNFGVINPDGARGVKKALFQTLRATTAVSWAVESVLGRLSPNEVTSPYVLCVAEKTSVQSPT